MKDPFAIVQRVRLTEKGFGLQEKHNRYVFTVNPTANKIEIRQAVEKLFKVQVKEGEHVPERRRVMQPMKEERGPEISTEGVEKKETPKKQETVVRTFPKVGRNDPCPCGSGQKYKKCHGA